MKKSISFILVVILLFTITASVFAEKCQYKNPKTGKKCLKELYWDTQVTDNLNGSHYVYDNYGNRYTCTYTYLKCTNVYKCNKDHHAKAYTSYTSHENHSSPYCTER